MVKRSEPPEIEPSLRTLAMPADANPNGDIFGGWLMSQMDLAGAFHAYEIARGRVATVAVDAMSFDEPVRVGDALSIYCQTQRLGTTSIAIEVQSWVRRAGDGTVEKVTNGVFTFVAIDDNGRPRPMPKGADEKSMVAWGKRAAVRKKSSKKKTASAKPVKRPVVRRKKSAR